MLNPTGIYFAYLRKSREDRDAEFYGGVEDTLARHEYVLNDLAARCNIKVAKWYREVVSGETISDRPEMITLLRDIETIKPDGVLVVEVERLSRGNPQDQGRVSDTFKYADTLIITPTKIYDLKKESDEEWLDFGLMRSRMEYRTIKRRLQNGRTTSAMQGKFTGSIAPFGWKRKKLPHEKGYTLEPDPDTAWVLSLIYTLLDTGTDQTNYIPVGTLITARILDQMGIKPPKGEQWDAGVIGRIAKNPANIGINRIGYRSEQKTMVNGQINLSRPINHQCLTVPARWEAQIDRECYDRVCSRLKANTTSPCFHSVKSPLAGVIYCSICNKPLRRRPAGKRNKADTLQCRRSGCNTVGSYYSLVEERLVQALDKWLVDYKLKLGEQDCNDWTSLIETKSSAIRNLASEVNAFEKQLTKVYTCFEQELYDLDTFLSRSQDIKKEIADKIAEINLLEKEQAVLQERALNKEEFIPYFEDILNTYKQSIDPVYKNALIKKVIQRVYYTKTEKSGKDGSKNDSFELDIHIKI